MSNSFARTSLLIKERLDTDLPSEVKSPTNHQTQLLKIIPTSPGVLKKRENSSPFLTLLNPVRSPQHANNNFSRYTPSDLTKTIDMSYERLGAQTPAVLNSNAPIQFPLGKSGSSSLAKISHISKNSLPESLILNRVNPIEAQAKLRSRLGNSRIEAIEANPGQEKKNRGEKRVANSAMSPRTVVGTYYNYHSQHLTFIPEKLDSSSLNKSSFLGFNDLARTTNSTHQSMLGSLVLEETAMNRIEGGIDPEKKIKALKKVLEFNKLQKEVYDTEIRRQRKEIILPLVKTEQDKQHKQKQMRHIKVLPSQNFYYQMNRIESMQQKSIITDAMNASMVTQSHQKDKSMKNDSNDGSEPNPPLKPLYIYRFFWYFAEEERKFWVPEAREGHTLTTVGKNIVLYGGCSNSTKSEIAIYQPGKNIWKQIATKGESPLHGRHGHTACEFKDCMIVFGGEERLGIDLQFKEYLCDARAFYPEKGEWRYLVCTGKAIDPRRNHAAAIHASTMYVYGGVTYRGEHLDDVWALNLKNYTWTQVSEESTNRHGIAYHTMCACFIEKNVGFIHKAKGAIKEFEDGFYVFGGKDEQGKCLNTLKYFDPSDKPIQWKYPSTKGTPPSARFNHTMLFYQPLALLVIYGGKNHLYEDNDKFMELNDIRVLNLETMTWNPTASFGHAPKIPRTNHAATLLGHAMIIFGGIGGNEYMPVQTRVVELNQISVAKLIDRQAQAQDSTNPEPQTLSPDTSPTFSSSPTLYKGEKKKVTVSFLPPPQQDAGGEDKTAKQNGVLKGVLKGALKGAVAKVRIMETWKKMRASLKNAAEADA